MGYGKSPPVVKWPNDARLAVQIVVNYEEGSEHSIEDGDEHPEGSREFREPVSNSGSGNLKKRDLMNESVYEYATRVTIWRMLNLFERYDVKATFGACAVALERNPEAAREIVRRGHEVCGHGYRWHEHFKMEREEERESIHKTVESITMLTGEKPVGWYSRGPSTNTRQLLVEKGGFLYDSDAYNDDLPYYVKVNGKRHLVVPYTLDANDIHFWLNRFTSSEDFFRYLKDTFDTLYEESAISPKMMSVGLHLRIAGRPGRIKAVEDFIRYAKSHPDVWLARRVDIAQWWLQHYPPT